MKQPYTYICILLSLYCFHTAQAQEHLYPKTTSAYHNDWTQKHYQQRIKTFQETPLTYGSIVFIGNSITEQGGDWSAKYDTTHIYNRGIAGDVTDGVLLRLEEMKHYRPSKIFLLIGINDLFSLHHDEDGRDLKYEQYVPSANYVVQNILRTAKQLHEVLPDTKIYVRTILPTRKPFLKNDILHINKILRAYAAEGVYQLIDLYSEFVAPDGLLKKELTKDGVHLTTEGYQKWIAIEAPYIAE